MSIATPPMVEAAPTPQPVFARPEPLQDPPARLRWEWIALTALLSVTATLYLWNLGASGWANSYYSAAAQAASQSWKAWFFGSLDAANSITVDKPPASLWVMGLSTRLFGVSSWSILVPQALMGVASVGLLYATVRRWFGPEAGLLAGAVLALTPAAALIFRFNNPDALLVLLMIAGAYFVTRAIEDGAWRWMALAGVAIGAAFMTKSLQAFLVLPALVAAYAISGPGGFGRRISHLLIAFTTMVVTGGWWVAVVELWPESSRPFMGGSQSNSALELILGYNGIGRLTGEQVGSVVPGGGALGAGATGLGAATGTIGSLGGPGGQSPWGETGISRLFNASYGGQAAWLIPAAIILGLGVLFRAGRAPRTDRRRAAIVLWGGWLLVTGLVISFAQGIIHEYYTVALAPAIGALVGIGVIEWWKLRDSVGGRLVLGVTMAVTAAWSFVLLSRSPDWNSWLRYTVLAVGLALAAGMVLVTVRRAAVAIAIASLAVALAGPASYAIETASGPLNGSIPLAGPAVERTGPGGMHGPGAQHGLMLIPGGQIPGGQIPGGGPTASIPGGHGGGVPGGQMPGGGPRGGGPGGGLLGSSAPSQAITTTLLENSEAYTWVAATVGAHQASGYQLASGKPVMSIGGFNGSDPSPTLDQFKKLVKQGQIHYFIDGGQGGPGAGLGMQMGGSNASSEIRTWVQNNFIPAIVDGVTVYDLTPSNGDSRGGAA